ECHICIEIDAEVVWVPPKMKGTAGYGGGSHRARDPAHAQAIQWNELSIIRGQKTAGRNVCPILRFLHRSWNMLTCKVHISVDQPAHTAHLSLFGVGKRPGEPCRFIAPEVRDSKISASRQVIL